MSRESKAFVGPYSDGMDLRDYFAAQAMTGLLLSEEMNRQVSRSGRTINVLPPNYQRLAWQVYQIADAMLEARES